AWVMHHSSEEGWKPQGTTNRGNLVHPARPLEMPRDMVSDGMSLQDYLQGKWTLLYIGETDCGEVCRESLYKMRQVRIAQNENMKRVQTLFLMHADSLPGALGQFLAQEHKDMAVALLTDEHAAAVAPQFLIDDAPVMASQRVYIVDPLGNLMMYYLPDADARGMLKDLQKLLKYSKIG
ncbi:MAG TPA: SCO family protein, partial [Gammaproteobacteria bacterium]|nr:SCO family protein [Gammaproteobacteria bacterium]